VRADIVRIQHWVMNAFVAERFRHGRILLSGDAAHAMPIVGGLGMNAGIADVHNRGEVPGALRCRARRPGRRGRQRRGPARRASAR
jgi:2-polyprenyl-6-methoxyphenol hydroxylase-like FAD-dependent oxidoreductase